MIKCEKGTEIKGAENRKAALSVSDRLRYYMQPKDRRLIKNNSKMLPTKKCLLSKIIVAASFRL